MSDPKLAYEKAVQLIALVSQELYSRTNAMLTANGLFFAAIGIVLTKVAGSIPLYVLAIALSIAGFFLCVIWRGFIRHGVYYQEVFRKEAARLEENYFDDTVRLLSGLQEDDPDAQIRPRSFRHYANLTVTVFQSLYIIFFVVAVCMMLWFSGSAAPQTPSP